MPPLAAIGAAAGLGVSLVHRTPNVYGAHVVAYVLSGAMSGVLLQWAAWRIDKKTAAWMTFSAVGAGVVAWVLKGK